MPNVILSLSIWYMVALLATLIGSCRPFIPGWTRRRSALIASILLATGVALAAFAIGQSADIADIRKPAEILLLCLGGTSIMLAAGASMRRLIKRPRAPDDTDSGSHSTMDWARNWADNWHWRELLLLALAGAAGVEIFVLINSPAQWVATGNLSKWIAILVAAPAALILPAYGLAIALGIVRPHRADRSRMQYAFRAIAYSLICAVILSVLTVFIMHPLDLVLPVVIGVVFTAFGWFVVGTAGLMIGVAGSIHPLWRDWRRQDFAVLAGVSPLVMMAVYWAVLEPFRYSL